MGTRHPGSGIAEVLAAARPGVRRWSPAELAERGSQAFVIDVRSAGPRTDEGHLPGAMVIDRSVLEWRLDPTSGATMQGGPTYADEVAIVCNEGYSSSLAARDLRALGFHRATDLVGGFRAYAALGVPVQSHPTRDAISVPLAEPLAESYG